jgi:two-component system KDP operon response regulator KdpE
MSVERPTILVVDDEPQIRRMLRAALTAHGFDMAEAVAGQDALRLATTAKPQLVILDLGLPDIDGFAVLERLREWSPVPVIVLSVRSREAEKVRALELGADDYVTKPFGMAELLARIRVALRRRRPEAAAPEIFSIDGFTFDPMRRRVVVGGAEIKLSPKQFRLLDVLVRHAGRVVTHGQLLSEVWGPAHAGDVQYLRVFVKSLRQKIEADPARPHYLLTELGVGYRMRAPQ